MKFYSCLIVIVALLAFAGIGQAAQLPSMPTPTLAAPTLPAPSTPSVPSTGGFLTTPGAVQIAARLFTGAVLEPNGSVAVCFATNLDSVARDLAAQIINSNGVDVTQTSSCGARMPSGFTCEATAHFANNSPMRCVVGTGGNVTTLRGGMTTSGGPFPFTSPANLTVPAQ